MRFSFVVIVLAATGLLAADLRPPTAPRTASAAPLRELALAERPARPSVVEIAFVRNGWVARVKRDLPRRVDPARFALRELLEGPTPAERRVGIRTAIPAKARVRSIRSDHDAWHVSVARAMVDGGTAEARRTRIWQIAATLEPLGEARRLVLATAGRFLTVQRLGVLPGALGADVGEQGYRYSVSGVQRQLALLGYLSPGDVTGTLDYTTGQALLAFQGWEDLARTGTVTGQTQLALFGASRPKPERTARDGRRVEIHRDLGVLLLVEDGEVVRSVHTSTGAAGATPVGTFRVYLKSLLSWSVPFEVWMPYASYFRGGIAMHQSPDVPSYPASHGCVRLPDGEAERVYRFVEIGTPVSVFGEARARPSRHAFGGKSARSRHSSRHTPPYPRGMCRLAVTAALATLGMIAGDASALAHFDTSGRYTHRSCPASAATRTDPVNVVFTGWGTWGRVENQVESHAGWRTTSGASQHFVDHGGCSPMHTQRASGEWSRFHVRARGQHQDAVLGWVATAAAHHEDLVLFPLPCGHAVDSDGPGGSGFDQGRDELERRFASAGHRTSRVWWGNTQSFRQCDGDYASSDGWTLVVELHQAAH